MHLFRLDNYKRDRKTMEDGVEEEHQPLHQSHLVVHLLVQVSDVLNVLAPLVAGDRDPSPGRQQVVNDGSVVILDTPLIFRAQLLLLGDVLPCIMHTPRTITHSMNTLI